MKSTKSWPKTVTVLASVLLGAGALVYIIPVLFPDFGRKGPIETCIVLNGLRKPLPYVAVRFRNDKGAVTRVFHTDKYGQFQTKAMDELCRYDRGADGLINIGGFVGTGCPIVYELSTVGTIVADVHDETGHPISNVDISLLDHFGHGLHCISNDKGIAQINGPVADRFDCDTPTPHWQIGGVKIDAAASSVRYDVTVVRPGTIEGHLAHTLADTRAGPNVWSEHVDKSGEPNCFDFMGDSAFVQHGQYKLAHLRPGYYKLVLNRTKWVGSTGYITENVLTRNPIKVASRQTATANFHETTAGSP